MIVHGVVHDRAFTLPAFLLLVSRDVRVKNVIWLFEVADRIIIHRNMDTLCVAPDGHVSVTVA